MDEKQAEDNLVEGPNEEEVFANSLAITVPNSMIEMFDPSNQRLRDLGVLVKKHVPGAKDMDWPQCLLVAAYAMATGLNPFSEDFYVWPQQGRVQLKIHYSMINRWASTRDPFYVVFEDMPAEVLPEGAIGQICILTKDSMLQRAAQLTYAFGEERARKMLTITAEGVVTTEDMTTKQGYPKTPPHGWTWQRVAQKRAQENAIRAAYGHPSVEELRQLSWEREGVKTEIEDWLLPETTVPMTREEHENNAVLNAKARLMAENPDKDSAVQAISDLFDDETGAAYANQVGAMPPIPEGLKASNLVSMSVKYLGFTTPKDVQAAIKAVDPDASMTPAQLWPELWAYRTAT